uniref:Uncharacterized protein n=1 Tax=Fagus sylvatica TaxID=28930 RepID=A0A2N9FF90_FAGSY
MNGLFLLSFSATFAEIAEHSGYDFVLAAFPTLSRLHVLAATPPLPPPRSIARQKAPPLERPKRYSFVTSGTGPKPVQPLRFAVFTAEPPVAGFWPIFLNFRFFQRTGPDRTPVPG